MKPYLTIDEFLQRDLEEEYQSSDWAVPLECVWLNDAYFPYRKKKQMDYHAELGFHDIDLYKKRTASRKKQSEKEWICADRNYIYAGEREWMNAKNLYQITDSRIQEGCLSEDIVYMNKLDYEAGELRDYDAEGNLVRRVVKYKYPGKRVELDEKSEYFYEGGKIRKAVFESEEGELQLQCWGGPYRRSGRYASKKIERTYFYDEEGSLRRTEDFISEENENGKQVYQEWSRYEEYRKDTGDRGGIPLSENTAIKETFRKSDKDGKDILIYRCTDLDFVEYRSDVKKRIRTELSYRKGSRKHPEKKITTYAYDAHNKGRVIKEFTDHLALLHDYRDIDEHHFICVTYRVQKEDVIDSL